MMEQGIPATLCEAFQATATRYPQEVALRTPGGVVTVTWREYADRVRQIAAGLAALGVDRGHAVGLTMTNRPEFHLVDTAAFHLGAAPFSIYNTFAGRADHAGAVQCRQYGAGLRGTVRAATAGRQGPFRSRACGLRGRQPGRRDHAGRTCGRRRPKLRVRGVLAGGGAR
jgi:hypothetical protein